METLKGCLKVIGIVLLVIVLCLAILIGVFVYMTSYKVRTIDTSVSPDGRYELVLESVGEPGFAFGDAPGRIVLKKDAKEISTAKIAVANDGGGIIPLDWSVTWLEDRAEIIVRGEEMYDELVIMYFDGNTDRRQLETHFGHEDWNEWVDDYYSYYGIGDGMLLTPIFGH